MKAARGFALGVVIAGLSFGAVAATRTQVGIECPGNPDHPVCYNGDPSTCPIHWISMCGGIEFTDCKPVDGVYCCFCN